MYYDLDDKAWRCQIWSENWPAMRFYLEVLETQWREGINGRSGLDYNVLLHELDRRNLPPDDYDDLFGAIRVIERASLEAMHKPA